jgi:hypothetical protein
MDKVRTNLDQIKQDVASVLESQETLGQLTLEELDEALQTKFMLLNPRWDERKAESKSVKERYMSLLNDEMDKLKAILHWKQSGDWNTKIDINQYKQHVMDYINNSVVEDTYEMAWHLIKGGKIVLSPEDIKNLDVRFIKYVMTRQRYKNPFVMPSMKNATDDSNANDDIEDEDEYENVNKTYMTSCERFWVNLIASGRDDVDKDNVILCLGMDVDQRLRYLPMKVTVFEEGDLLPQIVGHYKGAQISPMIKWRRNVGILLDNTPCKFHDYMEYIEGGPFMASIFTIELPYMCYVYVDRVEIDVDDSDWKWDAKTQTMKKYDGRDMGYVSVGDEYILSKYKLVKDNNSRTSFGNTWTICKKCKESAKPAYYVTISFGLSTFHNINAVRVYGKAISLV